jgi:N-acetylmuramic acid 6-phosphate etherase
MGGEAAATFLGIEGGGTKAVALLADAHGKILQRRQFGPLNIRLLNDEQLLKAFRAIARAFGRPPAAVGLYCAGCRTAADRQRMRELAAKIWPESKLQLGNDLESGLAAAFGATAPGILVISGTGSVVVGRNANGDVARAGGWGHHLGDHASAHWVAQTGLRNAIREFDRNEKLSPALRHTLTRLCLNSPEHLIDWIANASKAEVADLANIFLRGNRALMLQAASFLAMDCEAVARKLHLKAPTVALSGGLLQNNRPLRKWVTHRIRQTLPGSTVIMAPKETEQGTLTLLLGRSGVPPRSAQAKTPDRGVDAAPTGTDSRPAVAESTGSLLTEQRNPRTMDLDRRSVSQLIDTMLGEEARVIPVLRGNKAAIENAIETIVAAFKKGGRLFYVGAGTSGRIGVLDASECPPTFSTDPEMVQGIMAGGAPALHSPVEAGEDDASAGADAVHNRGVRRHDVVVGIAASGRTPYVLGALDESKRRGAKTFLVCFSPPRSTLHAPLFFPTGPEAITGSTRLKAGTATKLVLNMLTTISMIRLGKVVGNLMVDVKPTNSKLRARATRIVSALRGCSEEEARQRLEKARWNVKRAIGATKK